MADGSVGGRCGGDILAALRGGTMKRLLIVLTGLLLMAPLCAAQSEHDLSTLATGNFTTSSLGEFNNETVIRQSSRNSAGVAAGYEYWRHGNGYIVEFSYTPTDSRLWALDNSMLLQWPIQRYKIDYLYNRRFRLTKDFNPYLGIGGSQVVLWGGSAPGNHGAYSGWDTWGVLVAAGGAKLRVSPRISFKIGLLVDVGKASTYGDRTYQASQNLMFEPQVGVVWTLKRKEAKTHP
jgi:hypothetical protein